MSQTQRYLPLKPDYRYTRKGRDGVIPGYVVCIVTIYSREVGTV